MIRSRFIRSLVLVLTTAVAVGCSDVTAPTGPQVPVTAENGLISGILGTVTGLLGSVLKIVGGVVDPNGIPVNAVKWAPSHVNAVRSVSGTIGYYGGTLAIPGSDFTITFPRGALSKSTDITIISDATGNVSYDMLPHGITFATPVIVTQKLRNTAVYDTPAAWDAVGAYFVRDPKSGLLKAVETTTTIIFSAPSGGDVPTVQTWHLKHFSRYMLASG
jgi:hypothetical protein